MEEIENSTVNVNKSEASVTSTGQTCGLEMYVFIINLLLGLPTHSYITWLIVTGSGIATELFILNLSVCEIGSCLNCLLSLFFYCLLHSSLSPLTNFLLGLIITGRPLFQCLICVERYLAVVHPVTFLKFKPLRYRVICCAAAWIIILGSCFCCIFTLVLFTIEIYTCFFLLQFLLFLSVQLFLLLAVLRALKQSGPGEKGREREEENHMKRRAFNLILITTVTTVIIYFPYIICGILVIFKTPFISGVWMTALICYVLAGFVQPVLYLHHAGKLFRLCHC